MKASEIELYQTCGACPEQYNAFYKDKQVGYLRLRHGCFTVNYPDHMGHLIYEAEPEGDGCFHKGERDHYLKKARKAIKEAIKKEVTT